MKKLKSNEEYEERKNDRDEIVGILLAWGVQKYIRFNTEITMLADFLAMNGIKRKAADEWISVKDRLPDKAGKYLVFYGSSARERVEIGSFAKNLKKINENEFKNKPYSGWYEYDSEWGYFELRDITHWRPLPEPPKEGKQ